MVCHIFQLAYIYSWRTGHVGHRFRCLHCCLASPPQPSSQWLHFNFNHSLRVFWFPVQLSSVANPGPTFKIYGIFFYFIGYTVPLSDIRIFIAFIKREKKCFKGRCRQCCGAARFWRFLASQFWQLRLRIRGM